MTNNKKTIQWLSAFLMSSSVLTAGSSSTYVSFNGDCILQSQAGTAFASEFFLPYLPSGQCTDGTAIYGVASATSSGMLSVAAEWAIAPLTASPSQPLSAFAELTDSLTFNGGAPPGTLLGTGYLTAALSGVLNFVCPGPVNGNENCNSGNTVIPGTQSTTATYFASIYDPVSNIFTSGTGQLCVPVSASSTCVYVAPSAAPLTVRILFPIVQSGSYEFTVELSANVPYVPGDSGLEALLNDPLTLTLPPGVTASSASGVFPVSSVPEPSPFALVAAGSLALAASRRRL